MHSLEYVTLKHIGEPYEFEYKGEVRKAYEYVFTTEKPIYQVFSVVRLTDNKPLEIGKEYHVDVQISSFTVKDKKTKYRRRMGKYGHLLDNNVTMIYRGAVEVLYPTKTN